MRTSSKNPTRTILGAVFLILFFWGFTIWFASSRQSAEGFRLTPEARFARHNLRQILIGLEAYHKTHGVLPYHPNGSDHALYLLKDSVDVSVFALIESNDLKYVPYWDHEKQRIRNCGWEYLNEKDNREYQYGRIDVVSKKNDVFQTVYLGLEYGEIWSVQYERHPERKILGSYTTDDHFITSSKSLSQNWNEILKQAGRSSTSQDGLLLYIVDKSNDIRLDYEYSDRSLTKRRVSFGEHTIVERVTTDEFGRIIGVIREPSNWRELLSSHLDKIGDSTK